MSEKVSGLLKQYKCEVEKEFGDYSVRMLVFGSYARGDFGGDSDLDIMILVNMSQEKISSYTSRIYDMTYDFEEEFEMEINPVIQSMAVFEYWKGVYPFFMNVEKEGIAV